MARARNIKPGFYLNEELAGCSIMARFIFPGLWMLADRAGRLEDRPLRIKAAILPYDDANVDSLLSELENAGMINRYESENARYIQILSFTKHQTPHVKESQSTIPAPDMHSACTVQTPDKHDVNTGAAPPDSLNPDSLNPESPYLNPSSKSIAQQPDVGDSTDDGFNEAWDAYPQRPGRSKADALRAWRARIKEGISPALLIDGVKRYADYCRGTNTEPQFVKQPATFFGPGQHYLSDWTVPAARASPARTESIHDKRARAMEELTGQRGTSNERNERDITGECSTVAGEAIRVAG